jgi:hypothetical protein
VLDYSPYSPELTPNDFFLFLKKKGLLKKRHFDDTDEIRSNKMVALKGGLGAGIGA